MSFIGDLFSGSTASTASTTAPAGSFLAGGAEKKSDAAKNPFVLDPIEIDNPPQKPAKPPVDQKGGGTGDGSGAILTGGGNSLLGGGTSTPYG